MSGQDNSGDRPKKRKGGRPPASVKPLSEAEKAQRRGANWRHGKRASSAMGQALHPCRKDLCPLEPQDAPTPNPTNSSTEEGLSRETENLSKSDEFGFSESDPAPPRYPCPIKQKVEERGGAVDYCPVELVVNQDAKARFLAAIEKGDLRGLHEMSATSLAAMHGLSQQELSDLLAEGLVRERPLTNKNGDLIGYDAVTNPRAAPAFELLKMLGYTAAEQAITPKSQGERERDKGLGSLTERLARRALLADPNEARAS